MVGVRMSIYVNDNGTLRTIAGAYVNDNGNLRQATAIYVNDAGTLRSIPISNYSSNGATVGSLLAKSVSSHPIYGNTYSGFSNATASATWSWPTGGTTGSSFTTPNSVPWISSTDLQGFVRLEGLTTYVALGGNRILFLEIRVNQNNTLSTGDANPFSELVVTGTFASGLKTYTISLSSTLGPITTYSNSTDKAIVMYEGIPEGFVDGNSYTVQLIP